MSHLISESPVLSSPCYHSTYHSLQFPRLPSNCALSIYYSNAHQHRVTSAMVNSLLRRSNVPSHALHLIREISHLIFNFGRFDLVIRMQTQRFPTAPALSDTTTTTTTTTTNTMQRCVPGALTVSFIQYHPSLLTAEPLSFQSLVY